MIIEKIFQHAHKSPKRISVYYGLRPISYGTFAFWISNAYEFLSLQGLRIGSVAVLDVDSLLDAWVIGIALRSLGVSTVAVRTLDRLDELRLPNIECIVTTIRDQSPNIPSTVKNFKLIQIPHHRYLNVSATALPDVPHCVKPSGGHILLTSGTTGISKKVFIDSDTLVANLSRRADVYGFSEHSILNVFSYGMWTGVGYKLPSCIWCLGGTVVIHQGADAHRSLLIDGITHARSNPAMLSSILRAPANEIRRQEAMQLIVGGGPLSETLAVGALRLLTPHVFTAIASTEAGTWAMTRIERVEDLQSHCTHPLSEAQIVDEADIPVPNGQRGFIRVRSMDETTSYLDDEEASRRFFRHGFFYPGDLGSILPNGRLVLHGRFTNVINILGDKVAVEPIELTLQNKLGVDGVCIFSMPGRKTGEELHVVIESSAPIAASTLVTVIHGELPTFPDARIHFIATLPRSATGKLSRAELRRQLFDERADGRFEGREI